MVDLDTLKTVLRGLVVSNPGLMTIETLCRDYRTSEGHELPFRQLGFKSATDFLSNLRDTLKISGNTVRIVSSEETAHLESLIARQKKRKKKGRSGGGFSRKTLPSKYYMPPRLRNSSSRYSSCNSSSYKTSSYNSSSCSSQSNTQNQYPTAESSHRGVDNRNFQTGETRSRSPEENRRLPRYYEEESDYDSGDDPYSEFELVTPSDNNTNTFDGTGGSIEGVEDPPFDPVKDNFYEKSEITSPEEAVGLASTSVDPVSLGSACNGTRFTVKDILDDDDDSVSPKMQKILREIIQSYPSGLQCARLPEEYLRRYGVPLDCRQCGYVSVNQMAMALPNIFRCVRIKSGDWMLFDAGQPPPEQFLNSTNDDEDAPQVSGRVLERISSILSTKCRGVNLNDFSVNYMILYGSPLMDEIEGFDTMEDLFRSLNNTIAIVREVNGEMMVYPPPGEDADPNHSAIPVELTWEEIHSTLPPTTCKPDDRCPQISLPKNIDFGEYIVVRLGEIYSPWKFYIHLYGREYSEALDSLMDSMQYFYGGENKRKYSVPVTYWKRGQHCVALYDNEWHRAVILSIVDKHSVKVKYFDYGTIDIVRKTDLRLLDMKFLNLPMMAIKGKLSAIKPAKGQNDWSQEANQFFFSLIIKKRLVASVIRAIRKPPFLALALVDTEGGEDVHINDELVENGFAEYTSEESNNEWSDEADEPDYVEVDDGDEKWQTEVNKSIKDQTNKSSQKASSSQDISEESAAAAGSSTTSNGIKSLDSSSIGNVTSGLISPCIEVSQSKTSLSQTNAAAQGTSAVTTLVPSVAKTAPAPFVSPAAPVQAPGAPVQAPAAPTSVINFSAKLCRPPPGFKALDPVRAPPPPPPGLAIQGQNMYYMNNLQRPPLNARPRNMPPQTAPFFMPYNNLQFNQANLLNPGLINPGLQFPQYTNSNPMMVQQMQQIQQQIMASMRPNAPPLQQWSINPANQWNVAFNSNPYNQYMYRPPVTTNNPVYPPQYQQNTFQWRPSNNVPLNSSLSNNNLPNKKDVEKKQKVSKAKTLTAAKNPSENEVKKNTTIPLLNDVTDVTKSIPFLTEKMTPSPPPPPPGLTPPLTPPLPLKENAKRGVEAEVTRLSTDLSQISTGEGALAREDLQKTDDGNHQSGSSAAMEPLNREPQSRIDKHQEVELDVAVMTENETNTNEVAQTEQRPLPKLAWKPLDVGIGRVHLLNYKGEAYVSSDELARVCLRKSGHNELAETLQSKAVLDSFFEFNRRDNEEFFSSLDLCPGLKEIMCSEGKLKLNFIPLSKVVGALIAGGIKVPQVVFAFQSARRAFNPEEEYWKQVCQNPVVSS